MRGTIFLSGAWGACFLRAPCVIPRTALWATFLSLGPGSPSLSVTMPAFGNLGSETYIRGLAQREDHPRPLCPAPSSGSVT